MEGFLTIKNEFIRKLHCDLIHLILYPSLFVLHRKTEIYVHQGVFDGVIYCKGYFL